MTNSTFSGNSSFQHGGGINNDLDGTVTVTNSTFSGNSACSGCGGGIANGTAFGTTIVRNTIVANLSAMVGRDTFKIELDPTEYPEVLHFQGAEI